MTGKLGWQSMNTIDKCTVDKMCVSVMKFPSYIKTAA